MNEEVEKQLKNLQDWAQLVSKKSGIQFTVSYNNSFYDITRQKPGYNAIVSCCLEYKEAVGMLSGFDMGWTTRQNSILGR